MIYFLVVIFVFPFSWLALLFDYFIANLFQSSIGIIFSLGVNHLMTLILDQESLIVMNLNLFRFCFVSSMKSFLATDHFF